MFWTITNGRCHILGKNAFNSSHNIVLPPNTLTLMANIVIQGVILKEEPNAISHNSKKIVSIMESSLIDLFYSSNKDNLSVLYIVVLIFMNW